MPRNGNTIRGSNRDDVLNGSAADETIHGRRGDDTIDGGLGNDTIFGGDGNDVITAGPGDDEATGGAGSDIFVIGPTTDTLIIKDFEDGIDQIDVSAFNIDPQNPFGGQYGGWLANVGNDTYLEFYDLTTGDQVAAIILEDFDYTQIDISDYIF